MVGFLGEKRSMRPAAGLGDDQDTFGLFVMTCLCWPQTLKLEKAAIGKP